MQIKQNMQLNVIKNIGLYLIQYNVFNVIKKKFNFNAGQNYTNNFIILAEDHVNNRLGMLNSLTSSV